MVEFLIELTYLLTGAFAGLLSGLLGVGGGLIVVPALIFAFKYANVFQPNILMHLAVGTSLAVMIFTSSSSAYAYYKRDLIVWPIFIRFLPGLCLGIIGGSLVSKKISSDVLIFLFAFFLLIIAIRLFFEKPSTARNRPQEKQATQPLPKAGLLIIAASITGLLSAFFGIGGGLLMIPFFLYIDLNMHQSSGTSSLCGLPIAIIGTITLTLTGWTTVKNLPTPVGTLGYIYWPAVGMIALASVIFAPIGTKLAIHTKARLLKKIMAMLLIVSATNLLFN
jgi:hypothetical protein